MNISEIASIELDRTVMFRHCIRIKDRTGHTIELIPVKENVEWEQFQEVVHAWTKHKEYNGL